eukprot:1190286-Prorocentrum_minimum.AAC.8
MGAGASVYGALAEEFDDSCGATYVSGSTTGSPDPVINFNVVYKTHMTQVVKVAPRDIEQRFSLLDQHCSRSPLAGSGGPKPLDRAKRIDHRSSVEPFSPCKTCHRRNITVTRLVCTQ